MKLIINEVCHNKIAEWCRQLPDNEWSGTLFYKYISGSYETDDLVLETVDMYVSDIGASAYTEFTKTPDIFSWAVEHELDDCYEAVIHSHNKMAAFHSGTDIQTLHEQGKLMPHYLSLVVNNAGQRNCRITRQVFSSGLQTMDFGGKLVEINANQASTVESKEMEVEDIVPFNSYEEEVKERMAELEKTCYKNKGSRVIDLNESIEWNIEMPSLFKEQEIETRPAGVIKPQAKNCVPYIVSRLASACYGDVNGDVDKLMFYADDTWSGFAADEEDLKDIQCNMLEDLMLSAANVFGISRNDIIEPLKEYLIPYTGESMMAETIVDYLTENYE